MYYKYGKPVHNSFEHFFKSKFSFLYIYFGGISNKTIIQLIFVEYDVIIANLALPTLLAMYHIIIIQCILWNNC